MNELISVIVPVYNVEKYLRKCVESILQQTYTNLEIILVDDGSTDSSGFICDELSQTDSRIQVYHKINGGLSDARNFGVEKANGEYLMFIDSDDYINKHMTEYLHNYAKKYDADLTLCDYIEVYENTNVDNNQEFKNIHHFLYDKHNAIYQLFQGLKTKMIVAWNKLYKKEIFNELRYEIGKIHEDEFMVHKVLEKCEKVCYIDVPLLYYVQRSESIMSKTYSLKHLDLLTALNDRYEHYKNTSFENDALILLLRNYISQYFKVKRFLNDKEILKRIENGFNANISKVKHVQMKQWIKFQVFRFSKTLYMKLWIK